MRRTLSLASIAVCLALSACGGGDAPVNEAAANETAAGNETADAGKAKAELPACPFRKTSGWAASLEGGRLLVTGTVDLQMAGFTPALTVRSSAPPTIALDLALKPDPTAAVSPDARYEATGHSGARNVEIWCGGERIHSIDVIVVG